MNPAKESQTDAVAQVVGRYREQHTALSAEVEHLGRLGRQLSDLRLLCFVVGLVYAWAAWSGWPVAPLGIPVVAFGALVVAHARVLARRAALQQQCAVYEDGLARLGETWSGQGRDGEIYVPQHHAYAEDLDLFGPASLFSRLNTCRTALGEEVLAAWLLDGASREDAEARVGAVKELAAQTALREDVATLGRPKRVEVRGETLLAWAHAPATLAARGWDIWCAINGIVLVVILGAAISWSNLAPLLLLFSVNLLALGLLRGRLAAQQSWAEASERQWQLLAALFMRFEGASLQHSRLLALRAVIHQPEPASQSFLRLDRLVYLLQVPLNQFFLPIAVLTLWPIVFGRALERWRATHGPHFRSWLDALGELEALCAIGTYAHEHPEHTWATFCEAPCFRATGLAHPLLPAARRVANDIVLDSSQRLLVISGSNMSGKSTLLRSIGINAVLAMAGAPACAERLELAPLAVGATMRVHDSIQEGASRFYAEVLRLRLLLELAAGPRPLLFLCDEILHGTNSHDRLEGARAVIQAFQTAGAIGALSTHDLALTAMGEELDAAVNVHLQDDYVGDRLTFDYRLREGVVGKSNALALMRGAGLPV